VFYFILLVCLKVKIRTCKNYLPNILLEEEEEEVDDGGDDVI